MAMRREKHSEIVEISMVSRQPWQADHRQPRLQAIAVVAGVKRQTVTAVVVDVADYGPGLAGVTIGLGRISHLKEPE
jgi:hypothetical protein